MIQGLETDIKDDIITPSNEMNIMIHSTSYTYYRTNSDWIG